jgi:alkaline phosphatase D
MTIQITRRALVGGLALGTLGAPAILRAQQLFVDYPFTLGIAAGDPSPEGFVIWTRLAPAPLEPHGGMPLAPVEVEWQVASDATMKTVVQKGTALARPELAHSVHVEVAGLAPGRPYWYRFNVGRERSGTGAARTLPALGAPLDKVRFAAAGCQHYEYGLYTAYRHLAAEDVDFVFHYGDYLYENRNQLFPLGYDGRPREFVRAYVGGELYSLDDYRRRYAQTKNDPDLQAAHAAAAWFTTFDDHEVENNWAGLTDQENDPPEVFALRRGAAFQAYYEHMPLRKSSFPSPGAIQLYRKARYGNLLDAHFLDTRQFRSDQPCGDGLKPRCAGQDDPKASVMGGPQEDWLFSDLRRRETRWNLIAQQVMMMPIDRRQGSEPDRIENMDSWAGYNAPRERVLSKFAGLGNVVVVTGDEHQNFAGELRTKNGEGEAVAVEFVATSITSGGNGQDVRPGNDRIMAENPFLKMTNDQRGYLLSEITPGLWTSQWRVVDQVTRPGAPISTRQTFAVEHGKPAINLA